MSGTQAGGKLAAKTIKKLYGEDFYKNIGSFGGKNGHTGGFYQNRELAREAGAKGGRISRRGKAKKESV
jgi:general stress protein YciG